MKYYIFIFFLINSIYAQIDTTFIPIVSYWSKGDIYKFNVTKTNKKWTNGILEQNKTSNYKVRFEVIDSTKKGYKIKWTCNNPIKYDLTSLDKYLDKIKKYQEINVIYTTSEVGEFIAIENHKEISTLIENYISEVKQELSKIEGSKMDSIQKIMIPLLNVFNSKEGIEQIAFKEIQYFHYLFGYEFNTKEVIEFEQEYPNVISKHKLRGNSKLHVVNSDFENSICVLKSETILNQNDVSIVLNDFFNSVKDLNDIKESIKNSVYDIKDNNIFEIYFNPGIPKKITTNRETNIDLESKKTKKIETIIIEIEE